ncbi:MAG TPA: helix-turn-helix domain-containing protein [Bacillota bacterium]|nr:helix-turn-helix domain-containing protein [Bacillota bacterium]HOH10506.1 helix-turn-helix domain-containing protein [Bacillota bacterium]HQJ24918.1 helix-turn-helix domain-containing protein [Bacillota bacterium]
MRDSRRPGPRPRLGSPMEYGRPFLTVDEFCECLGLSRAEAYKFLRHNKLPIAKNGKKYLIPAAVVMALQSGDYYLRPVPAEEKHQVKMEV